MAPPTGQLTITIRVWEHDGATYACEDSHRWAACYRGEDRYQVVALVRQRAETNLRAYTEQAEPYYVEALMESVGWAVLEEPCPRCQKLP